MWRRLIKGFHQSLKPTRSFYVDNKDASLNERKISKKHHPNVCCTKLLPCAFQTLNRCVLKQIHGDQYQKDNEEASKNVNHHAFLEAFGWSGAIVFGLAVSKQLLFTRTWILDQDGHKNKINDQSLIELLTKVFKTQLPITLVVPKTNTARTPSRETKVQSTSTIKHPNNVQCELNDDFEAAAQKLLEVHEKALGEALNRKGIACLTGSRESVAIKYFQRASELKYPPASFNLGQCCELGIGTKQDFRHAAEWYKIASEQGHATAMYNLGVFYAHGWGGLRADIDTARHLFNRAANLGQINAKAALQNDSKANFISKTCDVQIPRVLLSADKANHIKPIDLNPFVNNMRSGFVDDIFQGKCGPENSWEVPLSSTVTF